MKAFYTILLSATVAAAVAAMGSAVAAARSNSVRVSGPETPYDVSDLRLSDPHKELRHLSRNLKLKRDQRAGVSFILQERTREIRLLLDSQSVSAGYRNSLAAKVMEDSNTEIETLLRNKQKRKFDKELAQNH
jgi:hypothetical protein